MIETARLRLRPMAPPDAPFLVRLLNEPSWLENIGDRGVRTLADAEAYVAKAAAHHEKHGFGLNLVEVTDGAVPVGMCGLLQRDTLPGPDLGFALLPEHVGRGYIHEAAEAVLAQARTVLGIGSVLAIVKPGNDRSIRTLKRLGFGHEGAYRTPAGEELLLYKAAG